MSTKKKEGNDTRVSRGAFIRGGVAALAAAGAPLAGFPRY